MATLQENYTQYMERFIVGMIPDMRTPGEDRSLIVESAAGIGFGKPVAQGTGDKQIVPASNINKFLGVTVYSRFSNGMADGSEGYAQYETANVRAEGPVVVVAAVAVKPGDLAGIDGTGFIVAGDRSEAIGKYEVTAAAGELTIINLT